MAPTGAPVSGGPPPPDDRSGQMAPVPPMPPSIIASQGQQTQGNDSIQKQSLAMATQKLLEFKNVVESLLTVMKSVDPESVALFMPAIEFGQAIEARLNEVNKRAATAQPSMAGMSGGASPQAGTMGAGGQPPTGGSAAGM